ncbi:hypothetical protein DMN91_004159 [Ooceraea biroi]|uniref:Cytochrome P450 4C1 n=1 Tax=Ooceraea biroi TaxID=2015173 RepID=A0A3L8DU98_OOCBI|nr:hypothetical protein DMN91_004159 [Ooceraea biroi]
MRLINVWVSWDPIFKVTKAGKEHDRSLRVIHSLVDKLVPEETSFWVIVQRKVEWKQKRDSNSNRSSKKRQALPDLLLDIAQDGSVLCDEDILEEVNTFMYVGQDTTTASIPWMLSVLGWYLEY